MIPGTIKLFANTDLPQGWDLCNGQTLSQADYPVLFRILGDRFGGDGSTTFALPNLQSSVPISHLNYGIFIDTSYHRYRP